MFRLLNPLQMDQHHQQKSMISPGYGGGDYDYPAADLDQAHQLIALQAGNPDAWRGFYQDPRENFGVVDDSSMRCLFPADASQGLSLSLYNADQSTAAAAGVSLAESFSHQLTTNPHDDYIPKPAHLRHDTRFFASTVSPPESPYQQPERHVTACKYLIPAQELLNEFCSLGGSTKMKPVKQNKWEERGSSSSSSFNRSLSSMDLIELQKRKAKLLSMLEEVDMRYRKYKEQTKAVVSTFEGVVGEGSATVYLDMASKAMSRHFRCLRDAIVAQVQETKKAMGEKDTGVAGATRGETPRLRLLDQCLRQQKAFNQVGVMGNQPWRPQRGLPEHSVSVLRAWLFEHFLHPYPSDVDKHILARQTGLSRSQVSNWFINARVRLWKPMVEEMYVEETKEHDYPSSHATVANEEDNNSQLQAELKQNPIPNPSGSQERDEKPAQVQLLNDSESLTSIVNHGGHRNPLHGKAHQAENFGAVVDLDFSSYNGYGGQSFGGGSGVSLTLGLQQHDRGGMSLSFSPGSKQSLYLSRENMDECPLMQFSIMDGEAQSVPYRNLVGAQILHDMAG